MTDIAENRVNTAQAELAKRAKELKRIIAQSKTKKLGPEFDEGVKHVTQLIEGQSKLLEDAVFEEPKTSLAQMRNLMLLTGTMNQSVQEGIKPTTDAIDAILQTLDEMTR